MNHYHYIRFQLCVPKWASRALSGLMLLICLLIPFHYQGKWSYWHVNCEHISWLTWTAIFSTFSSDQDVYGCIYWEFSPTLDCFYRTGLRFIFWTVPCFCILNTHEKYTFTRRRIFLFLSCSIAILSVQPYMRWFISTAFIELKFFQNKF